MTIEEALERVLNLPAVATAYVYGSEVNMICIGFINNNSFWDYKYSTWEELNEKIEKDLKVIRKLRNKAS